MTLPFFYSDEAAEEFLDELLENEDGWFRFVEQHRAWGFDAEATAAMIRTRSRGHYAPSVEHMLAMHQAQTPVEVAARQAA